MRDQPKPLAQSLYVVREIVLHHGDTIDVSSQECSGSTFTVWLPTSADETGL